MVKFASQLLHSLRFSRCRTTSVLSLFCTQNVRRNGTTWTDMHSRYLSSAVEASEFELDELCDDGKTTEKDNALLTALSQLTCDCEKESSLSLNRFFGSRRASVISTGSLNLDIALGIGGLPKGRFVEIYGREASGKTTLALHIIKEAQKLGGYCAYLDVENALDPCLAESIGVDTENLLISQPDSAENLLSVVNTLTISGSVDVIVVDSVAALIPQRELDALDFMTNFKYDIRSEIMTKALRKIHYSLCRSGTIIVFVNQVRSNVKAAQLFGPTEEVTCGGNALRFYSAVRLKMMRKGLLKVGDKVTGLGVCVQVVKNKLAPAMKKAELDIDWGRGISCECQVLELACEDGVVTREGNSYFIEGHVLNSKLEAERFLAQNEIVADDIIKKLRSKLFHSESYGGYSF